MGCKACESQPSGSYRRDCRDCKLRFLAEGPHFFASLCAGRLLARYIEEIRQTFGPKCDIDAIHAEIKAVAKRHQRGSLRA
jgi:hypothetical protein